MLVTSAIGLGRRVTNASASRPAFALVARTRRETMPVKNPAVVLVALAVLVAASAASASPQRQYVEPRTPGDAEQPPFSGAVRVGDTLYLSGDIGLDENRKVPDKAEDEARNVLDSMQQRLKAAGMTMDDLVFVQIFCSDVAHYAAFNKVYRTYFKKEFPARAFIGAGKLLFDARFEVQAIAVKR
jgi:reactive intermediate/imine deaminase